MKLGDIVDLQVYEEICCDDCNATIHNHIKCPVCNHRYAKTDIYGNITEHNIIQCECETVYEKVSDSWFNSCKAKIIKLNEKFIK